MSAIYYKEHSQDSTNNISFSTKKPEWCHGTAINGIDLMMGDFLP